MSSAGQGPLNPWRTIWWRPQATIKSILAGGAPHVLTLAVIAGMSSVLRLSSDLSWSIALAAALLLGPLLGLVSLYTSGALLAWCGWLLGGRAKQSELRTALAWSSLPDVIALPLLGVLLVIQQDTPRSEQTALLTWALSPAPVLLSLWSVFLLVRVIGAVQNFGVVRSITNIILQLIPGLIIAVAIWTFAFQTFNTFSGSMEPTLLAGDNFFVSKSSYGYSRYSFPFPLPFSGRVMGTEPERGDLVVFKLPRDDRISYVKRIIGLPGDEIQVTNGVLFINRVAVPRTLVGEFHSQSDGAKPQPSMMYEETLSNGMKYRVLDSEQNAPFDNVGPYKVPEGHYFVLGDSRDASTDSRAEWGVGYVPFENLVGRVSMLYFSAPKRADGEASSQSINDVRWSRIFSLPR